MKADIFKLFYSSRRYIAGDVFGSFCICTFVPQEAAEAAEEAAEKEKDDTWSKLGDTISQFFTSEDDKVGVYG